MNDKQKMTFVAGQYYRSQKGGKARYVGQSENGSHIFEAVSITTSICDRIFATDDFGLNFASNDYWHIAEEWVGPKRIRGWVNVTRKHYTNLNAESLGLIWSTRKIADDYAPDDRIACIEIDVLEGHGLEGAGQ